VVEENKNNKDILPEKFSELPILFTAHDGEFALGSVGLAVNSISGAYFDQVRIEPINVRVLGNETSSILYIAP
jgi:hypothetical protein